MTNYNKYSNKQNRNNVQPKTVVDIPETVEEPKIDEEVTVVEDAPVPVKVMTGIVVDCYQLNVREEPNVFSDVHGTISRNTKVAIDEPESTDEFYKVCTETGLEGFCMKKYVEIR